MTTALDTSCSENTMVVSEGEDFCMHVFSSKILIRIKVAKWWLQLGGKGAGQTTQSIP
jgi:hypothetical protein